MKTNLGCLEIRSGLESDTGVLKKLSDKIFGSGYLDGWFVQDLKLKTSICLVAHEGSNIVGMIYLGEGDKLTANSRFLKCIMVDDRYRRRGIGTSLYQGLLQALPKEEINYLYASCWKESPQSGIIPFLENQGWKASSVKENYWHGDSLKFNYKCIRCGNPCFCTAVLMNIDLSKSATENDSATLIQ